MEVPRAERLADDFFAMRTCPSIPAVLLCLGFTTLPLFAATVSDATARGALRRLPKAESQRLAKIVARGGTPVPESWHILSYDPASETGLRERIVENGAISDAAEISEYARYLTSDDVIARREVKIDTDRVFQIANQYALTNGLLPTSMNYTLEKSPLGEAMWRVDCLGEGGAPLGSLAIAAGTGQVLWRDGFPLEHTEVPTASPRPPRRNSLKLTTYSEPMVAVEGFEGLDEEDDEDDRESLDVDDKVGGEAATPRSSAGKKRSSEVSRSRSTRKVRRADPDDIARTVTRPVRRVLRRVLPF